VRIAVIDLGTNSVRFDVHDLRPTGQVRTLHREKLMIRLGQGVFVTGKLDPDAFRRATHCLERFHRFSEELHVSRVIALGTSALREARDAERFVSHIRAETGIELHIIPGSEEARLIALGILKNERPKRGVCGLIDIGGGSTEITVCRGQKIISSESFPLGTARLQQVFLKACPPPKPEIKRLRRYIRETLDSRMRDFRWPKMKEMTGSSGTIRTLVKVLKKRTGRDAVMLRDLSKLIDEMVTMTPTKLLELPGMEARRVDMIVGGAILLEECMRAFKVKKLSASEYSLRDGVVQEQIRMLRAHSGTELTLHLNEVREKARRLGVDNAKLVHGEKIATALFDRLKPLHKLDPVWRDYLVAAMLLRDTGQSVSLVGHNEHSAYVVRNSHFPFLLEWESEFIAELVRTHENGKPEKHKAVIQNSRDRVKAFDKLHAILSIADSLDWDYKSSVRIRRVSLKRGLVDIRISGVNMTDLEVFRVGQRRAAFEKAFHKKLVLKSV
jgi:exopolyphosphatase/guanosine-5'-triphosphate,3'-diphosphate pyrophosphatase